jgi:hypothetical protein
MTLKCQIEALECEAVRHTELAKAIALELLKEPFRADVEKKKQLAHDHLIRAEAYKTSQRIINGTFRLS